QEDPDGNQATGQAENPRQEGRGEAGGGGRGGKRQGDHGGPRAFPMPASVRSLTAPEQTRLLRPQAQEKLASCVAFPHSMGCAPSRRRRATAASWPQGPNCT